jgi:hypothetical protein
MEFFASLRGQDYRISPGDYQGINVPALAIESHQVLVE